MNFSLKKEERLKSRKSFEKLVRSQSVFFSHPLRITWIYTEQEQPCLIKVAFAVPKKNFKRANKRNLLKRRMREAYRLNKHLILPVLNQKEIKLHILIVYIGKDILPYHDIEKKICDFFRYFMEKIPDPA